MRTLLLALALSTPFWGLGHPAWEVDDARYLEVPREMAASGDWLTPTLDGMPYVEKPPLIYWLSAASYRVFGVDEAAGRLPLALFSLAGLLGVLWLGSWLYSPRVGAAAAVLLATCVLYSALSHTLTPDMALSVCLLWTVGLALRCLRRPEDSAWAGPLAWLALAAAFMSKGLAAPLLAAAWACSLIAIFPGLRRGAKPLLLNRGLPVAVLAVGAWIAAMERANPGFCRYFFWEQQFNRFLSSQFNRPGPPYYYAAIELAGTLPWTPLLLAGLLVPAARWRKADPRDLQLLLWVAGVLAFFSASRSKLPTYILPVFPLQALLGARLWERLGREERVVRWSRRLSEPLAFALLAASVAAPFVLPRVGLAPDRPRLLVLAAAGALACLGAVLALAAHLGGPRRVRAFAAAGLLALALQACLLTGARSLESLLSFKSLGTGIFERAAAAERQGFEVAVVSYDALVHGAPFYTRRRVHLMNWTGELYYARRFARYAAWFCEASRVPELPYPGRRTFLILPRDQTAWISRLSRAGAVRGESERGPWVVLEYYRP